MPQSQSRPQTRIDDNDTDGRVLLITGASSGIGAATARRAAEAGYRVALAARSSDKLASLADDIGRDGAFAIPTDVTEYESQENMVRETLAHFGRLDAVMANAGVGGKPGGFSGAAIEEVRAQVQSLEAHETVLRTKTLPDLRGQRQAHAESAATARATVTAQQASVTPATGPTFGVRALDLRVATSPARTTLQLTSQPTAGEHAGTLTADLRTAGASQS